MLKFEESNTLIKKELMLGLIYPAVLGTILYQALETVNHLVMGKYPLNDFIKIKLSLLLVSIGFYICDYLYITFTKRYYGWFFLCDIIFLITLYVTIVAIELNSPDSLPHNKTILLCYIIFLLFYLLWDGYEFRSLPEGDERSYFRKVVIWELCAIMAIGIFLLTDVTQREAAGLA